MSTQRTSAGKAIDEAKTERAGARAPSTHMEAWIRKVPAQVQALLDALVRPPSASSPLARSRHLPGDVQLLSRAAQYVATVSLIHSAIYLGRYLASLPEAEQAALLLPRPLMLLFAACMALADKFANDNSYDDLLPAIGIATGIQPKVLRKKEVQLLAFLMNSGGLFVGEAEFEAFVFLLEQRPWGRLPRGGALQLLTSTAREHFDVAALRQQLFSEGRGRAGALPSSLAAFALYLRTHRPRPRLPLFARSRAASLTGAEGGARPRMPPVVGGSARHLAAADAAASAVEGGAGPQQLGSDDDDGLVRGRAGAAVPAAAAKEGGARPRMAAVGRFVRRRAALVTGSAAVEQQAHEADEPHAPKDAAARAALGSSAQGDVASAPASPSARSWRQQLGLRHVFGLGKPLPETERRSHGDDYRSPSLRAGGGASLVFSAGGSAPGAGRPTRAPSAPSPEASPLSSARVAEASRPSAEAGAPGPARLAAPGGGGAAQPPPQSVPMVRVTAESPLSPGIRVE